MPTYSEDDASLLIFGKTIEKVAYKFNMEENLL